MFDNNTIVILIAAIAFYIFFLSEKTKENFNTGLFDADKSQSSFSRRLGRRNCQHWAALWHCTNPKYRRYMAKNCKKSCSDFKKCKNLYNNATITKNKNYCNSLPRICSKFNYAYKPKVCKENVDIEIRKPACLSKQKICKNNKCRYHQRRLNNIPKSHVTYWKFLNQVKNHHGTVIRTDIAKKAINYQQYIQARNNHNNCLRPCNEKYFKCLRGKRN